MTLDRFAHPTLVVVDMQNDFVRVGAPLEVPEARATIPAFTEPVLLAQGAGSSWWSY
jgi:nicotinamidase-related amidase